MDSARFHRTVEALGAMLRELTAVNLGFPVTTRALCAMAYVEGASGGRRAPRV